MQNLPDTSSQLNRRYLSRGTLLKGVGGLYVIQAADIDTHNRLYGRDNPSPLAGQKVFCRAKGAFRYAGMTPLCGDTVEFSYSDRSCVADGKGGMLANSDITDLRMESIVDRKNALIRPPVANLDYLFLTAAAASPAPDLLTIDKLLSIAEFNHIEPVLIFTKNELDPEGSLKLLNLYTKAGFTAFAIGRHASSGLPELQAFIATHMQGRIAAFAGASGVGKSTLVNALFPDISQATGDVARKTERGRQTTRHVELFPLKPDDPASGYLADTPGFSMLDFVHFDFFSKEDLPYTMRDFVPFFPQCRYTSCTHTKEEECGVVQAVRRGDIAKSRHDSYLDMLASLMTKPSWKTK